MRAIIVDDLRVMMDSAGSGGPSVVFVPGAGLIGLEYRNVHARVAARTTSVIYDRGGTGWSDPVPLPRTAAAVAGELRELLRVAGVPGPYLLAGHSLGALYARRFAQLFPDDVHGLVQIDPGHEDILEYLPAKVVELNEQMRPNLADLPDLTPEQLAASRTALRQLYAQWPEELREPLVEQRLSAWRTGLRESANMEQEVYPELRAGGPLPDVPMIVLTATAHNAYWAKFLSEELMHEAHAGIQALHAALAASVPRGEQRPLPGAAHQYPHIDNPDAVVQAITDLLRR